MRILIIDDDDKVIKELENEMRKAEYEVLTADTHDKGWKIIKEKNIDIIFMEIICTRSTFTGYKLSKMVREISPSLPILIGTGYVPELAEELVKNKKADAYITKPFNMEKVLELISLFSNKH